MADATFDPLRPAVLAELLRLAEEAAHIGGGISRDWFKREFQTRRKSDGSSVTDVDEAAQRAVTNHLLAARPDDAVIAEETLPDDPDVAATPRYAPANDRICWIIDPIDGTRNFICGVPLYACTVAAMWQGHVVVGVTYDPQRDTLYSVAQGEALQLDGEPVQPHGTSSRPVVGIPSTLKGESWQLVQRWGASVVVRNLGTTALHLALVGAGRMHASLNADGKLWDIAAGALMVSAAGGTITDLAGQPVFPLDVGAYQRGQLPCLASRDADVHARLLSPA